MKKTILFLLISFGIQTVATAQKNYQITAVAFYNLENLFDADDDHNNKGDDEFTPNGPMRYTEEIYKKKLLNLSRVLSELATDKIPDGPALVGVSEVENERVLRDLLQQPALKERGWRIVHFESNDYRGIDVAMLYNPKYFKVLSANSVSVDISKDGKRESTRDMLHVTGILSGDTVSVFVNHWPSRRGGEAASAWKRIKAATVCKDIIDSVRKQNPRYKAIVMGDLNDDPINVSVVKGLNAQENKAKLKPDNMYNPWMTFYKKGIGTLGYGDSWNLFDQILLTPTFLNKNVGCWQFYKAEIFSPQYLKSQFGRFKGYPHRSFSNGQWIDGYSDHFPTIVYLIREN